MTARIALLVALVLALAACGQGDPAGPEETPEPVDDGAEEVEEQREQQPVAGAGLVAIATVYPLEALAREVAPGADVRLLTAGGQDPHDLELSPGDRQLIETADVVLYMGGIDFQPQVEAAAAAAGGQVVAVADIAGADRLRDFDDNGHDDDADHGHDDDHGDVDPHVWFDAAVMADVAVAIGAAFAAADADQAGAYREHAQTLHDELLALDAEIDELLSGCAHSTGIVSHEAYAYLLEPRDLEQEGISGAGGHGEASPQRLAELTERIRAEGIQAVLAEPVEGRADAEALANEAGVELLEIDPLEIGHAGLAGMRYPDALRAQAHTFAAALECG